MVWPIGRTFGLVGLFITTLLFSKLLKKFAKTNNYLHHWHVASTVFSVFILLDLSKTLTLLPASYFLVNFWLKYSIHMVKYTVLSFICENMNTPSWPLTTKIKKYNCFLVLEVHCSSESSGQALLKHFQTTICLCLQPCRDIRLNSWRANTKEKLRQDT